MLRDSHSLSIERRPQLPSIMINFNLREVAPGEAIRADDWNALVGLLRDLTDESNARELNVGDGLELHKSSSGSTLLLDVGDFREEPETTEYEHPFKVTATISEGYLCIYVATGQWCKILSPKTANFLNETTGGNNFTLSMDKYGSHSGFNVCLFIAAQHASETAGHFEPVAAKVGILNIAEPVFDIVDGVWTISLATVNVNWKGGTTEVLQQWKSDVAPVWIHPQHPSAPSGTQGPTE